VCVLGSFVCACVRVFPPSQGGVFDRCTYTVMGKAGERMWVSCVSYRLIDPIGRSVDCLMKQMNRPMSVDHQSSTGRLTRTLQPGSRSTADPPTHTTTIAHNTHT
jgi:hypothetical protein